MRSIVFTCLLLLQFTTMGGQNASAETVKFLALGDSLTAGYGLGAGDGLTDVLEDKLNAKGHGISIINAGVSGDTTRGGLARLDWALVDEPDMVLLALGGNDMLRGLEPAQSYENLKLILDKLQDRGTPVLFAGMLAPANMGEAYRAEFDQIYRDLAGEYDVIFYPFFLEGVALSPDLNQPDGLHPNRAGVEVMAAKLVPYVEALLGRL